MDKRSNIKAHNLEAINDLNTQSPQPLYVQIKEALKKSILDGKYQVHERLPSENQLMKEFGVSRITVRQALRDLTAEGMVFSSQGKGTFVSKPKAVQDVHRLEGFGEAMSSKGYETSARLISIRRTAASREVSTALALKPKSEIVEVVRIRYLNHEPISVDTSFFLLEIGEKLFAKDLTGDIFPLLENQLGHPLGAADIRLEARASDKDIANLLQIDVGNPIMWVERLTKDQNGQPVDFEYLAIRGDSYQYHFTVDRNRTVDTNRAADTNREVPNEPS